MDIVTIHLIILALTAVAILISDHYGVAYVRGTMPLLPKRRMELLHGLVWLGLLGMIGTGLYMAYPGLSFYIQKPEFVIKMVFVLVLVVNALFIGTMLGISSERPFAELTVGEKRKMFISGAVSSLGWIGAATIGFLFLS